MQRTTKMMGIEEFRQSIADTLSSAGHGSHAVWYLNLKKFRFVNDTYGHDVGDKVLESFGSYLANRVASRGHCARIADDRFVVFVTQGRYESEDATSAFESLYREFNLHLSDIGLAQPIDIAAGVYFLTPDDVDSGDVDHVIDQANAAHRRAREQGGNQVIFFDYEYAEKQRRAHMIEADLTNAIASGEIEVWMQPLLDFVKGEVVASEALARWNHAKLGSISPAEFIPVLERAEKIGELDRYVWNVACYEAYNRRQETGELPVPFSVNVSRSEILDPTLPDYLESLREKYGLPTGTLRLEVTESAYTDRPEELIRMVTNLRDRGFVVEMDDFGSGYSSLNMLRNLPVDVVKLDMGFLRDENSDSSDAVILNSVIRMAHGLDIPVIAEGVETIEQAEMLKTMGCRLMQGYFFAKPMPIEQFYKLLSDTKNAHHTYSPKARKDKVAQLLDQRSDTGFFFNNCVGPAFIFGIGHERYEVMLANDDLYDELQIDRREADVFNIDLLQLMDEDGQNAFVRATRAAADNRSARCVIRYIAKAKWIECSIRAISSDDTGGVFACYVRDATAEHELELAMRVDADEDYASHDELTGLLTYHALDELVGGVLGKEGGTLMLVDIDDFDTYAASHETSSIEAAIDHVANILRFMLPKDSLLARCGEGLFAAFLPSVHDKIEVRKNACGIVDALRCQQTSYGDKITCSLGLAHTPAGTKLRMGIVYRRALRALTIAKINGGDGFLLYETVRAEANSGLEVFGVELRHAIDGELLPMKALEGDDLFNIISRDFEQHHSWNMTAKDKRSVRDTVFGALRYRSMAELPGVLSFDYDVVADIIYLESVDRDGGINQRCIKAFTEQVFGLGDHMADESIARLAVLISDLEYLPSAGNVDLKCRIDGDTEFRWYRFCFTSLRNDKSFVIRGIGYGEDIDLARESGLWWKDRAMHDGLTGLLNREGLEDAMGIQLAKTPGGMMFIVDVDDFKSINDQLGHLSGDSVLCELADALLTMFREHDVVARYGSDEMVAFISGLASRELATARAKAIVNMASNISMGALGMVSVCVGVAVLGSSTSFAEYLELADHAVHCAKTLGPGNVSVADEAVLKERSEQLRHVKRSRLTPEGRKAMQIEARYNRERHKQ